MTTEVEGLPALPGTQPRRGVHYELMSCGVGGHVLVGAGVAQVRPEDAALVREFDGLRWNRCLRCDAWLPGVPPAHPARPTVPDRSEITLPLRGRPLRDRWVLRLIALDRAVHVVVLATLAVLLFVFASHEDAWHRYFVRIVTDFQGGLAPSGSDTGSGLVNELRRLFSVRSSHLYEAGGVVSAYAVLEAVEGVGLWFGRRWAEYLTFVATILLVPIEVYELSSRVSVLKVVTLIVNVLIAVYLLLAKRLFGLRGGGRAESEERRRDVSWEAIDRATPAGSPRLV
ncbi:MAG TPA: DUF2127 domain-containing protein [Acidimicrobiales bacterium]|nr:DUF2127 domain-containing protein [Acidimicrobiales bacterium]